ncbi:MAG: hypothetical protein PUB66_05705, partial [Oscillospiraceae bacterium]|nr:hypothetical protein [Oscillospiraceae bacterium]
AITAVITLMLSIAYIPYETHAETDEESTVIVYNLNESEQFKDRTVENVMSHYNAARQIWEDAGYDDYGNYYDVPASVEAPYHQGVLNNGTLRAMESMTNFYRWLAGSEPLIEPCLPNDNLQYQALDRNFEISHEISQSSKPEDMPQELWNLGFECRHNILAMGFSPLGAITGWINEGYNLNKNSWDGLGHRYSLISPSISDIQFGYSGNIAVGIVNGYKDVLYDDIFDAFPSPGSFPDSFIKASRSAWNVGWTNFQLIKIDKEVKVTITNLNTGEVFCRTTADDTLHITYGGMSFVQPDDAVDDTYTDSYKVEISGLTSFEGNHPVVIEYTVDFFNFKSNEESCVKSFDMGDYSKLYVDETLGDTISLKKLAAVLPKELKVKMENGYVGQFPVSGHWVLDESKSCWRNSISLPDNFSDSYNKLDNIEIPYMITKGWYSSACTFEFAPSEPKAGDSGSVNIDTQYINTNFYSKVFRIVRNSDGTFSGEKIFDSKGSAVERINNVDSYAIDSYTIDSYTKDMDGEYVSITYKKSSYIAETSKTIQTLNVYDPDSPVKQGGIVIDEDEYTGSEILGDADNNCTVDLSDVTLILSNYAHIAAGYEIHFTRASLWQQDINSDESIDILDATAILSYYAYKAAGGNASIEEFLEK